MIIKNILIILLIIAISIFFSGCFKAPDTDGDGHRDPVDDFPQDPNDWKDSDKDGIGDNAEKDIGTNPHNSDSDGDNYSDGIDLDPLNGTIGIDSDEDSYHDAVDAFPEDANEWADTDGDGYGDNSDKYPAEPLYHTSVPKNLSNFSYEEIDRVTIYENGSSGTEYTISITNNDDFSGNFTTTVYTCNCADWTKKECIPGTQLNISTVAYVGSNETEMVKVRVFSDYMKQTRTFIYRINVTSSEVEQPV
ncbi:MAG: hypothetical protein K8R25_18305 [Methanosarcinales archaeon]|nr:hypothetical protein [Methanosarcinales archaeon]